MRIHSFDGTNRFRKAARRLHPKVKKELIDLFDEFERGELSPGRKLEKLSGQRKNQPPLHSVRLDDKHRFIFQDLGQGVGKAIAVGPHDAYRL